MAEARPCHPAILQQILQWTPNQMRKRHELYSRLNFAWETYVKDLAESEGYGRTADNDSPWNTPLMVAGEKPDKMPLRI